MQASVGTVYVMKLKGLNRVRIGHHSKSNKGRENQVKGGTGEAWKVTRSIEVGSKLDASTVEAVAHALLTHKGVSKKRKSRRTRMKGLNRLMQVYACSSEDAWSAIERAIQLLEVDLNLCLANPIVG